MTCARPWADFANEDQTGFIWTWLDHARDQSQVVSGAVPLVIGQRLLDPVAGGARRPLVPP